MDKHITSRQIICPQRAARSNSYRPLQIARLATTGWKEIKFCAKQKPVSPRLAPHEAGSPMKRLLSLHVMEFTPIHAHSRELFPSRIRFFGGSPAPGKRLTGKSTLTPTFSPALLLLFLDSTVLDLLLLLDFGS